MNISVHKIISNLKAQIREAPEYLALHPISLATLMSMQFTEPKWLVHRLIPATGFTCISGNPSNFKTWFILSIALGIAGGEKVFNEFDTSQGGVLIVDEENGCRTLKDRIARLTEDFDLPLYFKAHTDFRVENEKQLRMALNFCLQNKIKVIIFDSLVRIHSGDENSAGDMSRAFSKLQAFTKEDIVVIFTHHHRKTTPGQKTSGMDMRGSSDILASLDCLLTIHKNEEETELTVTQAKLRVDESMAPFILKIEKTISQTRLSFDGKAISEKQSKIDSAISDIEALLQEKGRLYKKQIIEQLNEYGKSTIGSALKRMKSSDMVCTQKGKGKTIYYQLIGDFAEELFSDDSTP